MTLPAAGSEMTHNDVLTELSKTGELAHTDADLLALAGKSAGAEMSHADLAGKSAAAGAIGEDWGGATIDYSLTSNAGTTWCGVEVQTDGDFGKYASGGNSLIDKRWFTTGETPSGYEIKAVQSNQTGQVTGTFGSWLPLNVTRRFYPVDFDSGAGTYSEVTIDITIRLIDQQETEVTQQFTTYANYDSSS